MRCDITDTLLAQPTRMSPKAGEQLRMWEHVAIKNRYKYKKRVSAKGESRLHLAFKWFQGSSQYISTSKFHKDDYSKLTGFSLRFKANKEKFKYTMMVVLKLSAMVLKIQSCFVFL